jgi:hypothetical protein
VAKSRTLLSRDSKSALTVVKICVCVSTRWSRFYSGKIVVFWRSKG